MRVMKNVKAISKLSLILLLLTAGIIGAISSYMFVMGYYFSLGLKLPEKPSITIVNATFSAQDATTFNVTILNPSYSPSTATITGISVTTEDGASQTVTITYPSSRKIEPGSLENFTCSWDWSNHTGETVTIHAVIEGGLGATLQTETPFMDLEITDAYFNSTLSTTQFNLTVQNSELSVTDVDITGIVVYLLEHEIEEEEGEYEHYSVVPTPSLPLSLNRGSSETFVCEWNWTDYRSEIIGISVYTSQGYKANKEVVTPERVILNITEAVFNVADATSFNITVRNSELSSVYVNITKINVTTAAHEEITIENVTPSLPHPLQPNSQVEFNCPWNWTDFQNQNVTVTAYTLQGYTAGYNLTVPLWVNLTITEVIFDKADTTSFNVTVKNPELSPMSVNITKIEVKMENGTAQEIVEVKPSLPYKINTNDSQPFTCSWNWKYYRGKIVNVTVYTAEGYIAFYSEVTPPPVELTMEIDFNLANSTHFTVTVENSESSIDYVVVSKMELTLLDGTFLKSINVTPTLLLPSESVTFACALNWIEFPSSSIMVTAYTLQGYTVTNSSSIPPWINITITDVFFDPDDTTYFNVTLKNFGPNPDRYVNITGITVKVKDEIIPINYTTPGLPFRLDFNANETFKCQWNWTNHRDEAVVITVYTREGHILYYSKVTPPPIILDITEISFGNATGTYHFNVTVKNHNSSLTCDVIRFVTVALQDGTVLETIDVELLILNPGESHIFYCSWDWTGYEGTLTITVYSIRGYMAEKIVQAPVL